mgnify:CR=1 FL=1
MSNEWEGFFAIKIISILALNVSVVESDFGLWTEEGPPPMVQHDEIDDEKIKKSISET